MFSLSTPLSLAVWFILLFPISNLSTISNLFCSIFVPFLFLCRMKYVNFSYKLFISHFFRDYKCVLQIDYTFFCSLKLNSIKEIPWHHIFQVLELFIVRSQILLYRTDVKPDFIFFRRHCLCSRECQLAIFAYHIIRISNGKTELFEPLTF